MKYNKKNLKFDISLVAIFFVYVCIAILVRERRELLLVATLIYSTVSGILISIRSLKNKEKY